MLIHSKFQRRLKWLVIAAMTGVFLAVGLYLSLRPQTSSVQGVLLNVEATSPVYAERVVLRDGEGRTWTFRVSPEVAHDPKEPQSASHLRQHMSMAEPVRVYYRTTSEGPLAIRIVDPDAAVAR